MGTIVDSHIHLSGREDWRQVIASLDEAGVTQACLIGPFLDPVSWVPRSGTALDQANDYLLKLVACASDRLWALVTVDPRDRLAPEAVRRLADKPGVRGLKLIPHDWDPGDARDVYAACEAARLPILFHSGIFISGRCSDRCRPARFEVVRDYPALKVVLAHLGWPWVDEAIAVALMDPLKGQASQISLDLSPGTPPVYRDDALHKAFSALGAAPLLFASDLFCPFEADALRARIAADRARLQRSGATRTDLDAVFGTNAAQLFGPRN